MYALYIVTLTFNNNEEDRLEMLITQKDIQLQHNTSYEWKAYFFKIAVQKMFDPVVLCRPDRVTASQNIPVLASDFIPSTTTVCRCDL